MRIQMYAREVVAFRERFRPRDGAMHDPDVALDEVLSLRASQEPLVLRVTASGGSERARSRIDGDWLCEPGGEPSMIGSVRGHWQYSPESSDWSEGRRWVEAWELCENAAWLLCAAASVGVCAGRVIGAGVRCLRLSPGTHAAQAAAPNAAESISARLIRGAALGPNDVAPAMRASYAAGVASADAPQHQRPGLAGACVIAEAASAAIVHQRRRFSMLMAESLSVAGVEWEGGSAPSSVRGDIRLIDVLRASCATTRGA